MRHYLGVRSTAHDIPFPAGIRKVLRELSPKRQSWGTAVRAWIVLALLAACGSPVDIEPWPLDSPFALPLHSIRVAPEVSLGARVEMGHDELVIILTLANPGPSAVTLETGRCPFRVRGFLTPDLREPAFWDDQQAHRTVCTDVGLRYQIPPGGSELTLGVLSRSNLASGYPDQAGYFGVVVRHNDDLRVLPGGAFGPP